MKTVVEPQLNLTALWGRYADRAGKIFRLMRYVMRIDHEDKVLLHNVVTGQLVALDESEAALLEKLPSPFTDDFEPLIDHFFLVPMDYDEHQRVVGTRELLRKLEDQKAKPGITHYTIFPTTACNARCYYCFEQGCQKETMTEETANTVVEFIRTHCAGQKVWIRWFGGEPTVAANRIRQICEGLHENGIEFSSKITTNGYLFDEALAEEACSRWNLESAMICVDGTEERYNRVKAYVNAQGSAYQRVLKNIETLLAHGIRVNLRMNFDKQNYHEFKDLLMEAKHRYKGNPLLDVYVHQINGFYSNVDAGLIEGDEKWFGEQILELNKLSRNMGLLHKRILLPHLDYRWCIAAREDAVTILPRGDLVSCPEQMSRDQFKGDLEHGITNKDLVKYWKHFADYKKCQDCVLFPECAKIRNCEGKDRCFYKLERINQIKDLVGAIYNTSVIDKKEGSYEHEIRGTEDGVCTR